MADSEPDNLPELAVAGAPVQRVPSRVRNLIVDERLGVPSCADSLGRLGVAAALYLGGATVATVVEHPLAWLVFWLVGGQVIASLFAAEHEALHGSMFDSPFANHVVGVVVGALCCCPYAPYRAYHLRHHVKTHEDGDSEPPLIIRTRLAYLAVVPNVVTGLAVALWIQLCGTLTGRGPTWAPLRRTRGLYAATVAAALLSVGAIVGAGSVFGWAAPLKYWAAPALVGLVIAGFLAAPEHYELPYGPAPVLEITRTTVSNSLTRYFMWNANYHAAHHLVAVVPGRNLGRVEQSLAGSGVRERSYLSYHWGLWRRIGNGQVPEPPPWKSSVDTQLSEGTERTPEPDPAGPRQP